MVQPRVPVTVIHRDRDRGRPVLLVRPVRVVAVTSSILAILDLGPGGQRPSELGLTTTTSYYLVVFVDGGSCTVAVIYRSRSTLLRRKPPKQVPSSHHLSPILHS